MQDVAYGDKIFKLENGQNFIIPLTIRLACHKKIIIDYNSMCKNENIKPLSNSTCYKILKNCPASFRKSMQGLDNVVADGLNSFDQMENLISKLSEKSLNEEKFKNLKIILNNCKIYLKFNS